MTSRQTVWFKQFKFRNKRKIRQKRMRKTEKERIQKSKTNDSHIRTDSYTNQIDSSRQKQHERTTLRSQTHIHTQHTTG